jgi:hypothetical protein
MTGGVYGYCRYCDSTVFEKSLPADVYKNINAKTAVTNWLGVHRELNMAIDDRIDKWAC